jgi:VWFA-related protein
MTRRRWTLPALMLGLALAGAGLRPLRAPAAPAGGQNAAAETPVRSPEIIKSESELVLVDVVATDKKDHHVTDLEAKDFRVYQDGKEQTIASFSHVSAMAIPQQPATPQYIVLYFDNSSMSSEDQIRARQAAEEFVPATVSNQREMAVVDFGGVTRLSQNFTSNPQALRAAVKGLKFSSMKPNEAGQPIQIASLGAPSGLQVRSDFAARSVLLSIRNLCQELRKVKGRKTMILFSAGFPLNSERESELTATIDAANKANVAIYPVDVRGLQGFAPPELNNPARPGSFPQFPPGARRGESPFPHQADLLAALRGGLVISQRAQQHGHAAGGAGGPSGGGGGPTGGPVGGGGTRGGGGSPGTGGGAGARPGSGAGSTTGGSGTSRGPGSGSANGAANNPYANNPFYQPGNVPGQGIIPPLLQDLTNDQQVLYALAKGTGGFTIFNTNDFKSGLEKIRQDLDDYYIIGYVPPKPAHDGSYHTIKVKVERHGVELRARNGYYDVKGSDLLAGKPEGKILEARVAGSQPGQIPVSVSLPYFYTQPEVARVNLAVQFPAADLEFHKESGKYQAEINVLGIAYRPDGSVAARFSDAVKNDFDKKTVKELRKEPFNYHNVFDIAPGKYTLKLVLSTGGKKFGKVEAPLSISPFTGKEFSLSGLALCSHMHPLSEVAAQLNTDLLEERTPLVVKGFELTPSADHDFSRNEKVSVYLEIYEPAPLQNDWEKVGVTLNVLDRKTNQQIYTTDTILVNEFVVKGSPVIPVALLVPLDKLPPGSYRLDAQARDSLGHASPVRSANFKLD